MNEQQRQALIEYIPNFVALLHEAGVPPEQTIEVVHSSIACIFAALWKVPTSITLTEEEQAFLLAVQVQSIKMFYGNVVA